MEGITSLIGQIVNYFVNMVTDLMFYFDAYLDYTFNIYIFSDTGWFNPSIPLTHIVVLIMAITIFIFLLRLLWKGTKKFIRLVLGVFRI